MPSSSKICSARCASLDKQANSASELRKLLYARERGVCRACRWDASACARRVAVMRSRGARRKHILSSNPRFGARGNAKLLEQLVRTAWEGHAWHFDHIVAVYEGGGECSVENGQTLCVLCHKARTAAQAKARAEARRAAKKKAFSKLFHAGDGAEDDADEEDAPQEDAWKRGRFFATKKNAENARVTREEGVDGRDESTRRSSRDESLDDDASPSRETAVRVRTAARSDGRTIPTTDARDGRSDDVGGYAPDSQLATTDEEAEEASAREGVLRDVRAGGGDVAKRSVSDSEPIPETEPLSRTASDDDGAARDRRERVRGLTFAKAVFGGKSEIRVPAFAGAASFDPDHPDSASERGTTKRKAPEADLIASLGYDSDDDAPWVL